MDVKQIELSESELSYLLDIVKTDLRDRTIKSSQARLNLNANKLINIRELEAKLIKAKLNV